jgi:CubicO group peptidase (beta-lactamase class C family)
MMRRPLPTLGALLSIPFLIAACGGRTAAGPTANPDVRTDLTPVQSTADWPTATLDAEGLDARRLTELVLRIRRGTYGGMTSLLVARNGRLVLEEYFTSGSATSPHTLQSVTKSVTSLLAGIAIDRGRLALDDRVLPPFERYAPIANREGWKDALTVRDLLKMQTGLDWSEDPYQGSPLQRLNDCRCDWLRFILDWRMRESPGTRWEYVSGGVILLGGIIGEVTGERVDRFAQEALFAPLGIQGATWVSGLPDGLPHTGGGLFLRPPDIAKIGQLVLDQGQWQSRQIVSADWIRRSTARSVTAPRTFGSHPVDYGFLWWIMNPSDIITASGAGGQWIFISPRDRLVVVTTASNDNSYAVSPADFLYSDILASLR